MTYNTHARPYADGRQVTPTEVLDRYRMTWPWACPVVAVAQLAIVSLTTWHTVVLAGSVYSTSTLPFDQVQITKPLRCALIIGFKSRIASSFSFSQNYHTMMFSTQMLAKRAAVVPAGGRRATPVLPKRTLVIRRFKVQQQCG